MTMNPESEPLLWYVAQLKPNGLGIATTHLARQGYHCLMPLREVSQKTRYGLRTVRRPLFPGYLFFANPSDNCNWRAVAYTRGIARVMSRTDGQPARLPYDIVENLLQATTEDGLLEASNEYQSGDQVGVVKGPFTGWLAEVTSTDDEGRIRLLVDVMGRETLLRISGRDLEKRS